MPQNTTPKDLGWDGFTPQQRAEREAELKEWEAALKDPLPGWTGFRYANGESVLPEEPPPSHDERLRRCKEMGLVICSCSSVQRDGAAQLIYNVNCPIHGQPGVFSRGVFQSGVTR